MFLRFYNFAKLYTEKKARNSGEKKIISDYSSVGVAAVSHTIHISLDCVCEMLLNSHKHRKVRGAREQKRERERVRKK